MTRVEAADIKIGMYVAELDQPWIDTDFLFQGFLIYEDEQLEKLQKLCKFVYVDEEKSATGLFAPVIQAAAPKKVLQVPQFNKFEVDTPPPKQKLTAASLIAALKQIFAELCLSFKKSSISNSDSSLEESNALLEINHKHKLKSLRDDFAKKNNITDVVSEYKTTHTIEQELDTAQKLKKTFDEDIGKILTIEMNQANISTHIELAKEFIGEVVESIIRNPDAMVLLTNLKQQDGASYRHALDVSVMLISFGRHLGIPKQELNQMAMGGLLHDIGKSKIPESLLNKVKQLNNNDWKILRQHVNYGLEIIDAYKNLDPVTRIIVAEHHERYDGTGYPNQLAADSINLYGAMAAIVEAYSAMTSPWPYAKAKTSAMAVSILVNLKGKAYHPELVDHFIQVVGVYPIGAIVELTTGEVGIVIRQNKHWRLKPLVNIILDADKNKLENPYTVDLVHEDKKENDQPLNIIAELPVNQYGINPKDYFL